MRFIALIGALLMTTAAQAQDWKLVIHGGAGVIEPSRTTPETDSAIRVALNRSLEAGSKILASGGDALDAVEAAVLVLEDDPNFNAGRGAVFTWDETHELDASIMDGRTRAAGAIAGVTATKNPISVARAVMEKSPHVLLSGEGADQFSKAQGFEQVPNSYFSTPRREKQLQEFKTTDVSALDVEYKYGTVGAVALDSKGHVAAATSTGGTTGKRWGRVGDSPIIGAGTYADDRACAVSATGKGEFFIRASVAHEICARVRLNNESGQSAADAVMDDVKALGGDGGVIVVTPKGEMVFSFNTVGMYRGRADSSGRTIALYSEDEER
ncbi:MAG: isoaspartyl peptidase/L-asparaginase family protein [Sphingomicrobium sp.]